MKQFTTLLLAVLCLAANALAQVGGGPSFVNPFAIALEADGNMVVADNGLNAIIRLDVTTGDRTFASGGLPTAVEDQSGSQLPQEFALQQNYPNPFNPSTTIAFELPQASAVKLAVYNMQGQLVRTLVNGQKPSGSHSVVWDGLDDHGARVASGVYLYTLKASAVTLQRKLVLMK